MTGGDLLLTPEEEPQFKLLVGLCGLEMTPHEAGIVSRITRFAQSPRLLEVVASEPKWYARWEVREALFENARTPDRFRSPLETSFAVIDLMRELDHKGIQDAEQNEIREDIRSLLRSLPAVDVEVVKAHARSLAASARLAPEHPSEAPPAPEACAATVPLVDEETAVTAAGTTCDPAELCQALEDSRERVRETALASHLLTEPILLTVLGETTRAELLVAILTNPRWSFRDPVRKALLGNVTAPASVRTQLTRSQDLLLAFMRYFNEPLEPAEKAESAKGILAEVQSLPAPEREYLKAKVGPAWTPFIREVMAFIEDDFKRIHPVPVTTGLKPMVMPERVAEPRPQPTTEPPWVSSPASPRKPPAAPATVVPESPTEALARDHFDDTRHAHALLHEHQVTGETRRALGHLPLEERTRIALSSTRREELAFLLHDADDRVFDALLANPALPDLDRVQAARTAPLERIRRIVANREVYALTGVKTALLHNPHAPEMVQIECLLHVSALRELLLVMRDPRVRSLEVKAKARARLQERYRAMGTEERVAAVKQTGGDLLQELWTDVFQDERTLLRLVADRSLDEGVVVRIARSRIAPREVLAAIGRESAFTSVYTVRLELAQNPKTPREIVAKLLPKLSPADRDRIRASKQVADFVRDMA